MTIYKAALLPFLLVTIFTIRLTAQERFPDGTPVTGWFHQYELTDVKKLGPQYRITDFGVLADSNLVQTGAIQAVIDSAAAKGGVIVVPRGTFLSGSLFFRAGTHLHLEEGATLKGSDDISDFALLETRIEGQTVKYFAALVNADKVNGFTLSGKGTLNGNGLRYWKAFWLRRAFNPQCTNMDEMRPRLLYISNSRDVQVSGVRLINSPFWTSHYYNCENLKILGLYIYAPAAPVKAPSSDAIDLDGCRNVLIKNCYMSVNDDAVALKGGKGPNADKDPRNGGNFNIIIEDNTFGFCHGALTLGSESIHNRNIILRRITIAHAQRLLWLKMRPDTPQLYEYVIVEDIKGSVVNMLYIQPWTQFFDLKGEKDIKMSYARHISLKNLRLDCDNVFNVNNSEQYKLAQFTFKDLTIKAAKNPAINKGYVEAFTIDRVSINGQEQ